MLYVPNKCTVMFYGWGETRLPKGKTCRETWSRTGLRLFKNPTITHIVIITKSIG